MSRRIRDAMVAFAEQGCRFLAPVFVGDQITPHFTVELIKIKSGKDMALTSSSRAEISVPRGHHSYFVRVRPSRDLNACVA